MWFFGLMLVKEVTFKDELKLLILAIKLVKLVIY